MRLNKHNIYGIWIRSGEKFNPLITRASYLRYDLRVKKYSVFSESVENEIVGIDLNFEI